MADCVIIYGKSGTGKSYSLINMDMEKTLYIGVVDKRLPFRNKFKYRKYTDKIDEIKSKLAGMASAGIKTAIVDDAGYLMTTMFMEGHGKGDQFKLFNDIGNTMWQLLLAIKKLPSDTIVYLIFHEEMNDFGDVKLRTIGKLLDQKVCLEGMVTICIRAIVKNGNHLFLTQNNGTDITKSPAGMFESNEMPNDLKVVDDKIREYYGMNKEEKNETSK